MAKTTSTRKPTKKRPNTSSPKSPVLRSTSKDAPPAASIAAAQKVLSSVDRRAANLRAALKRQKTTIKDLEKAVSRDRDRLKSLKSDLDSVAKQRKVASRKL
jgi:septal ring factor EnvC (AmiA/AmiB activator)